jgi:hypothetical protein
MKNKLSEKNTTHTINTNPKAIFNHIDEDIDSDFADLLKNEE